MRSSYDDPGGRYDARLGRHDGSCDLSNPQSFNRYAYVLNNPLSYTDPSGLDDNCVVNNDGSVTCSGDPGSGDPCATNTSVCVNGGGGGGNYPCLDYLTYYNCGGGNNGNTGGGTGGGSGGGSTGGSTATNYGPPHIAMLSSSAPSNTNQQYQPNPSHCQGLSLVALAYGAGVAKDAAKDIVAETANYFKAAAPLVGAGAFRIISSVGEPTLGLLAGAAVESGVAEGAGIVLGGYLGYQGITAAIGFYKEKNANCQ